MAPCIEDALREIQSKAALVEFMAQCAAESQRVAEAEVFHGLGDVCGEIRRLADRVKLALDARASATELHV